MTSSSLGRSKSDASYMRKNNNKQHTLFDVIRNSSHRQELFKVRLLLEAGADPNQIDENQHTPLLSATLCISDPEVRVKVVGLLLACQADPNLQGPQGETPLMTAAILNQIDTVLAIVDCPATDLDIADEKGNTALMYAAAFGHTEVVDICLGAFRSMHHLLDITKINEDGRNALEIALKNGHTHVAQMLQVETHRFETILNINNDEQFATVSSNVIKPSKRPVSSKRRLGRTRSLGGSSRADQYKMASKGEVNHILHQVDNSIASAMAVTLEDYDDQEHLEYLDTFHTPLDPSPDCSRRPVPAPRGLARSTSMIERPMTPSNYVTPSPVSNDQHTYNKQPQVGSNSAYAAPYIGNNTQRLDSATQARLSQRAEHNTIQPSVTSQLTDGRRSSARVRRSETMRVQSEHSGDRPALRRSSSTQRNIQQRPESRQNSALSVNESRPITNSPNDVINAQLAPAPPKTPRTPGRSRQHIRRHTYSTSDSAVLNSEPPIDAASKTIHYVPSNANDVAVENSYAIAHSYASESQPQLQPRTDSRQNEQVVQSSRRTSKEPARKTSDYHKRESSKERTEPDGKQAQPADSKQSSKQTRTRSRSRGRPVETPSEPAEEVTKAFPIELVPYKRPLPRIRQTKK